MCNNDIMINYPVICNILIYLHYMYYCTCEHLKCNKSQKQKTRGKQQQLVFATFWEVAIDI